MAREIIELRPVSHITADAMGQPGQRSFYLQGRQSGRVVTVLVEKEQVQALAQGIQQLLEQIDTERGKVTEESVSAYDLVLQEPLEPVFRAGQMGLGYDETEDLVVLVAQEVVMEGQDENESAMVRFWGSRAQMRALSRHALEVVAQGRKPCPLCGRLMNANDECIGCPKKNGHRQHDAIAQ